jgi:hypothetical protein
VEKLAWQKECGRPWPRPADEVLLEAGYQYNEVSKAVYSTKI